MEEQQTKTPEHIAAMGGLLDADAQAEFRAVLESIEQRLEQPCGCKLQSIIDEIVGLGNPSATPCPLKTFECSEGSRRMMAGVIDELVSILARAVANAIASDLRVMIEQHFDAEQACDPGCPLC